MENQTVHALTNVLLTKFLSRSLFTSSYGDWNETYLHLSTSVFESTLEYILGNENVISDVMDMSDMRCEIDWRQQNLTDTVIV